MQIDELKQKLFQHFEASDPSPTNYIEFANYIKGIWPTTIPDSEAYERLKPNAEAFKKDTGHEIALVSAGWDHPSDSAFFVFQVDGKLYRMGGDQFYEVRAKTVETIKYETIYEKI